MEDGATCSSDALTSTEEPLDIGELQLDECRAAVVALARIGRAFHFAQEGVHLLGPQPTPGAHRMVAGDGGDITFRGFRDGIVFLTMKGSCAGCPSSTATLKHGIQNLLRHFLPDVQEVEAY